VPETDLGVDLETVVGEQVVDATGLTGELVLLAEEAEEMRVASDASSRCDDADRRERVRRDCGSLIDRLQDGGLNHLADWSGHDAAKVDGDRVLGHGNNGTSVHGRGSLVGSARRAWERGSHERYHVGVSLVCRVGSTGMLVLVQ